MIMKNKIKVLLSFLPLIIILIACQTVPHTLLIEDPDFNLDKLRNHTVILSVPQFIENNMRNVSQLPFLESDDFTKRDNADVEIQSLMVRQITENLNLFIPKALNKDYILEHNNGSKILLPIIKKDGFYKVAPNTIFNINEKITEDADYILVPLAIQLEDVDNINERFKSIDLVEPGTKATISYAIYGVKENKIVVSGVVDGVTSKTLLIDRAMGKDDITQAVNNAIYSMVEEFRKY